MDADVVRQDIWRHPLAWAWCRCGDCNVFNARTHKIVTFRRIEKRNKLGSFAIQISPREFYVDLGNCDQIVIAASWAWSCLALQINEPEAKCFSVRLEELVIDVTAPMDEFARRANKARFIRWAHWDLNRMDLSRKFTEIRTINSMFESSNFPKGHSARDDTIRLWPKKLILMAIAWCSAHTSTMQNRVLMKYTIWKKGEVIAAIVPDRVFRNEETCATNIRFLSSRRRRVVAKNLRRTFVLIHSYFPFTEHEFALSCPFCEGKLLTKFALGEGWIELLGCGMIQSKCLLRAAQIDLE